MGRKHSLKQSSNDYFLLFCVGHIPPPQAFCLIKSWLLTQQSFVSAALGNEQGVKDTDKERSQRQGSEWGMRLAVRDDWILQASLMPLPLEKTPGKL